MKKIKKIIKRFDICENCCAEVNLNSKHYEDGDIVFCFNCGRKLSSSKKLIFIDSKK